MITVFINKKIAYLDDDFSFRLVKRSPLFVYDRLPAELAMDINFPKNDYNEELFDYPGKLSYSRKQEEVYIDIRWSGRPIFEGYGMVVGYSERIVVNAADTRNSFAKNLKDKYISEYDYGHSRAWSHNIVPNPDAVQFPIINKGFFDNRGPSDPDNGEQTFLTKVFKEKSSNIVNYYSSGFKGSNGYIPYPECAFPLLKFIYRTILEKEGYYIKHNVLESEPYSRICIYNHNAIGYNNYLEMRESTKKPVIDGIKYSLDEAVYKNISGFFDIADCLPRKIKVSEFIFENNRYLNIFPFKNGYEVSIHSRKDILKSNSYDNWEEFLVQDINMSYKKRQGYKLSMHIDKDDEIINERYRDLAGYIKTEKDNKVDKAVFFDPKENVWKRYRKVLWDDEVHGETDRWFEDYFSIPFNPVTIGNIENTKNIKTKITTLSDDKRDRYPVTYEQGNWLGYADDEKKNGFKYLLYHGFVNNEPYGSSGSKDQYGQPIPGCNFSLNIEAEGGVYDTCWKEWIHYEINKEEFTAKFNLDINAICDFDILKKKRIDDGIFFINEITTPFKINEIGITEAKCFAL